MLTHNNAILLDLGFFLGFFRIKILGLDKIKSYA